MADSCLNAKYETSICSSVCETVAAMRYAEKLREQGFLEMAMAILPKVLSSWLLMEKNLSLGVKENFLRSFFR